MIFAGNKQRIAPKVPPPNNQKNQHIDAINVTIKVTHRSGGYTAYARGLKKRKENYASIFDFFRQIFAHVIFF